MSSTLINKKEISEVKIQDQEYLYQYLPPIMVEYTKDRFVHFKGRRLKTSYLIDIVHNLMFKFYLTKENKYNLSSIILKFRYGQFYNYYIDYLTSRGILELIKNHQKGVNSRIYRLSENISHSKVGRFCNYDTFLNKKNKTSSLTIEDDDVSNYQVIDNEVRKKLIRDLDSVSIIGDKAQSILSNIPQIDFAVLNRNMYSVECINLKKLFYHFDKFGRVHTNFTVLKSTIRKECLLIDGLETCEIDIKNSQPFFLCKIIESSHHDLSKTDEYINYKSLVKSGELYDYLSDNIGQTRGESKDMIYKVFFGKNNLKKKSDRDFKNFFPQIYDFLKSYKKEYGDYKIISHRLQNLESDVIFNNIVKELMYIYPEIKLITVHDSIICQKKYFHIVNSTFQKNIKKILT